MPLFINKTPVVKKISGPVSIYLLIPKSTERTIPFPGLPVYMLFGDIHESNKNMCEEDKFQGTYNIYDIDFLNILSTLSTRDEPIDFFVEGGDFHNETFKNPISQTFPMHKIWNLYVECPNRGEKKLALYSYDKTKCKKMSNIRWQSGDARNFQHQNKTCTFAELYRNIITHKLHEYDIYNYFVRDLKEIIKSIIDSYTEECIEKLLYTNPIGEDYIYEEVFSEKGIIMKQLRHLFIKDKETIMDYMKEYLDFHLNKYIIRDNIMIRELNIIQNHLGVIISNIKEGPSSPEWEDENEKSFRYLYENRDMLEIIDTYIVKTSSVVLDLYTFCRSLKYTKKLNDKEPVPILDICYFGNNHVKNMVYFLTNITEFYDIVYYHYDDSINYYDDSIDYYDSQDYYDNINRCLQIEKDIHLDDILMSVKEYRSTFKKKEKKNEARTSKLIFKKKTHSTKRRRK
jgi:hypothetical protein